MSTPNSQARSRFAYIAALSADTHQRLVQCSHRDAARSHAAAVLTGRQRGGRRTVRMVALQAD